MSKNINQLYKDKFDNFEPPVPDGLWNKIEQNPQWQKHLRQQRVRNLAIYAGLAIVAVGTCVALLLRQTDKVDILPETDFTEENNNTAPTQTVETIVTEELTATTPAIEEEINSLVIETKVDPAPIVESAGENTNVKTAVDNTPINESATPQTNSTTSITPESHDEKTQLPVDNKKAQDTQATKIETEPSTNSGTPQTTAPENNGSNYQSPFSIPNAFTPNGDGLNDIFKPFTAEEIMSYQLDIFMVNGQHIFSSKNIDYGWNGEFQGSLANGGSYIYIIKYKDSTGKEHIDKGQLLLIR